jgi:hypothetical protein
MPRTTAELVRGIIDIPASVLDAELDPFILTANELVTEKCSAVVGYSEIRLELIERWLAAHFYAIWDAQSLIEEAGTVKQQIESKVDLGFDVTRWGQQAMRLDTNGALAVLNNSAKKATAPLPAQGYSAQVRWLGRR